MAPAYASPAPRSTVAILALYVKIGACLLAVGADVRRIVVAGELRDGRVLIDALLGADQLVTLATLLELAALVVAAALFLRWQVAAHRNLSSLGPEEPRVGVRTGVAAWFVPGVNLVLPYRVVADLWRAGGSGDRVPWLLRAWWTAWLVALVAVVASRLALGDAADVAARQRIDALRAAATALSGVAAAFAIAVLVAVTSRQDARGAAVSGPPPTGAPDAGAAVSEGGLRVVSEQQAHRDARGSSVANDPGAEPL